jgi:hypothetical protein
MEWLSDPVSHANRTLIQTANSVYLFVVTVPAERRGLLVSRALGECPANAQLVGPITEATGASADASCLRTGSRAVFIVESDGVCKRVITSRVGRLAHAHAQIRSGKGTKRFIRKDMRRKRNGYEHHLALGRLSTRRSSVSKQ